MGIPEQIRSEQDHVDRTYHRIDELREQAVSQASESLRLTDAVPATIADREAALAAHGVRRNRFVIGDQSICFGRLDTHEREVFHIGRLGVSDAEGDPMLVDWRAPIAEAFYRATPSDPRGMSLRRHIRMRGRSVVALDDEPLDRASLDENDTALVGEAALLAALAAPRRGQMGDIVATIQAQQDEAIRAPLRGVLVVQGGPGTGKTAVALHRAAYLLYAHELELSVQGVLVVGPNKIFARYVENVLPGLGETGVRLATPAELVAIEPTRTDAPDVARTKGALAMVDALRTTLWARCAPLTEAAHVGFDRWRLELTPDDTRRILDAVRADDVSYAEGRARAFRGVLTRLTESAEAAAARSERAGQISRHAFDARVVRRRLSEDKAVRALTSRIWPRVAPAQLVDETLTALGLPRDGDGYSVHDLALLDEATTLIGEATRRSDAKAKRRPRFDSILERQLADMDLLPSCRVCGAELAPAGFDWVCQHCDPPRPWRSEQVLAPVQIQQLNETIAHVTETFREAPEEEERTTWGHVLVDEAQELTPMQWRMLSRRCPTGSFTIVGDLNQASGTNGALAWDDVGRLVNADRDAHVLTLDVNYRTPEEIMRVATEVLRAADSPVDPPRSVRATGEAPRALRASTFDDALAVARHQGAEEVAATAAGTVVILVPDEVAPLVGPDALDARLVEMGVDQARGLEFDSVIVVEPSRFGAHELYVALTRATARLTVVHADPLPEALASTLG